MDGKVLTALLVTVLVVAGLGISLATSGQLEPLLTSVGVTVSEPSLTVTFGTPGMPEDAEAVAAAMEGFGLLDGTSDRRIVVDTGDRTIVWSGSITDGRDWEDVRRDLQRQIPAEWEAWTRRVEARHGGIRVGH